jgi:FecR protein
MKNDYLWDRSGPVDREVAELEGLLAPLRYREPRPPRRWYLAAGAVAAAMVAALAVWRAASEPELATGWQVARMEGGARLGGESAAVAMPLRAGQVLRTGSDGQLTLEDGEVGRIDLGPDSEMRAAGSRKLRLDRGELHAFIWAPPREFNVDTPSARAVDLGCEYTLEVSAGGDELLRVMTGWVAFQFEGSESFIPAGAECATNVRTGPGIPYFEDAPAALREAAAKFEPGDAAALDRILEAARPRDGLTLWHLLTRVPAAQRGTAFDRFAQLVKLPADVTRDAVVERDPAAIDLCWDALELENTSWWRGWERNWPR